MRDTQVLDDFKKLGGTEIAPMSTTADKDTALKYAESRTPLLFKYETTGLEIGCSINFLSVYPGEKEYLYAPLTYLHVKHPLEEVDEDGVTVITVKPQRAG